MDELVSIGERIAEIRNKRGFTQEKLAEKVNYSANHIAKLESARTNPSFELLIGIAKALDVQIKDLFDFNNLHTVEYMKKDLIRTIENTDSNTIQLLYKFKNSLLI